MLFQDALFIFSWSLASSTPSTVSSLTSSYSVSSSCHLYCQLSQRPLFHQTRQWTTCSSPPCPRCSSRWWTGCTSSCGCSQCWASGSNWPQGSKGPKKNVSMRQWGKREHEQEMIFIIQLLLFQRDDIILDREGHENAAEVFSEESF